MGLKERLKGFIDAGKLPQLENDFLITKKGSNTEIAKEMAFKAFANASHPMAISNLESGIYVDVNDAFLKVIGCKKKEIIGHTSDDIQVFADIEESNKYIRLLSKFKKVSDFPVNLKKRNGEKKPFLFSSETIKMGNEVYLLTSYNETYDLKDNSLSAKNDSIITEILETIGSYLAIFSLSSDNKILVKDINHKVEEIEHVNRSEVINKCINDTNLSNRTRLVELLNHLQITGQAHKLSASLLGDDSEGYYMGFLLSNDNFVITWEPGYSQKLQENNIIRHGLVFEKFSDSLPEMIFELDLTGRVTYANPQGLKYFGYSTEDFGREFKLDEIFPPKELHRVIKNLKTIKSQGDTTNNKYFVWKKDGTKIPINARTFGVFQHGKLIGYRGVVTDISEQQKFEEQIIREKAFLEHLIDSTPEAIVITDIPGKITLVNKEFTNLFGYTAEEAIDKYIDDLVVPDELKDEALQIDDLSIQNRKEIRQTIRKDKFGNRIHVSLIASTIVINNVTVAHLGIYRDITAEKKNQLIQEILFNISTTALKQFDIKDIYPVIISELSKIWDTNNFFIALYDKISHTFSLPFFMDEKDSFNEIPAKGTITAWVINNNKSVLLKEKDLKKMEEAGVIEVVGTPCKVWMGVPLKVESDIIGVMCLQDYNLEDKFSFEDLNILEFIANQIAIAIQRRTMLDNLILARQKAEEAAQSKQTFMSTMSHEIRTLLNEVIGITNLLMQGNPREDQMDLIKTLRFSGNHLMNVVNEVLDYNKMESGKIVFEQTQFNLIDFLDEIMRSYSFRANEKKLKFDIIKDKNLPDSIIGDPIRLNQILSNLLSNALKFTLEGGIKVYVVETERIGNQSKIEFKVVDTGIGIPKDRHSDIFDSFTQASTDTTRRFGGTGLGLAICKKLIELQGGTIKVESEPDKGSSFIFSIFVRVSERQVPSYTSGTTETFKELKGKRILVAEDNKINFFVANKFLIGWGMIVSHVENGQLVLEMLKKEEFDLILMDLHMPIMDGIEATRIIRSSENARIKDIPIIALTAAIMSESNDKIEDLNINDYVLKPFKPQDLYDRILKHIR
jgi:PAS domain S-box-containing protein